MGSSYSEPIFQACYNGDTQTVFGLLREDPSLLNQSDATHRDTPLIAACRHGNQRTAQYLLDNGADPRLTNKKKRTCLHYASRWGFSLFDYLMIAILMPILLLGYFIMLQKQRRSVALMEEILKTNVNIDAVDYKGNTALHYVCKRKSLHLLPLLLDRQPDASIQNNQGETALDIALRLRYGQIVQMLRKTN